MKLFTKLVLGATFALGVSAHGQVLLQDFSSVLNPNLTFFYGSWEATGDTGGTDQPNANFVQDVGRYLIAGATPTDSADSKVEFFNEIPVNLAGNSFISVSAQIIPTNVASSFKVFLIDTTGKTAYAAFAANSFLVGSFSAQAVQLTASAGFNPASIDSMFISGDQPGGTARFNIAFDAIYATAGSAIPEPATYAALIGALALGVVAYRRRQVLAA